MASSYSPSKDRTIAIVWQDVSNGKGRQVRLVSYDGGPTKVTYEDVYLTKAGEQRTRALKRVPVDLWRATGKAILETLEGVKQ